MTTYESLRSVPLPYPGGFRLGLLVVDVSDLAVTKETVTQAEAERRIIELERKRLRVEAHDAPGSVSQAAGPAVPERSWGEVRD